MKPPLFGWLGVTRVVRVSNDTLCQSLHTMKSHARRKGWLYIQGASLYPPLKNRTAKSQPILANHQTHSPNSQSTLTLTLTPLPHQTNHMSRQKTPAKKRAAVAGAVAAAGCTALSLGALYIWIRQRKKKAREYQKRVASTQAFRTHARLKHKAQHKQDLAARKERRRTLHNTQQPPHAQDLGANDDNNNNGSDEDDDDDDDDDDGDDDGEGVKATLREEQGVPRVAILGAGVSGLAAAYYLKKKRPDVDVHLFEADDVIGGNIQTIQTVNATEQVRIETGPRSLRTSTPSAKFALQLIDDLGIGAKLAWANKDTRGRRFVFDEDTHELEEMPTSLKQVLAFAYKHNLLTAVLRDIAQAVLHTDRGSGHDTCEAFFTKHFSAHLARHFLTALVHGIFSGEASRLLLRYAFPAMWQLEQAYGSIVLGSILDPFLQLAQAYEDPAMPKAPAVDSRVEAWIKRAAKERIASLQGGLTTLTTALWERLTDSGVHMHMGTPVALLARVASPTSAPLPDHEHVLIETDSVPAAAVSTRHDTYASVAAASAAAASGKHHHGGGDSTLAQSIVHVSAEDATAQAKDTGADTGTGAGTRAVVALDSSCTGVALMDSSGEPLLLDVDCVISTLPPPQLHALLARSLPHLSLTEPAHRRAIACADKLARVRSLSIAVVTFVFLRTSFERVVGSHVQPGFGFLMPRSARREHLLGVVYDSCVFPALAGPQHVVMTAMLGGEGEEHQRFVEESSEEALLNHARTLLGKHLGVTAAPDASRLTRWIKAIPQFDNLYAAARTDLTACVQEHMPWLFVGGKAFGFGVGVNDCIVTSEHLVAQVTDLLS